MADTEGLRRWWEEVKKDPDRLERYRAQRRNVSRQSWRQRRASAQVVRWWECGS